MGDPYEDGDKIGAAQWLAMVAAIRGNAVVSGLSVTVLSGMTVRVAAGLIYYASETRNALGANEDIVVSNGDATYDRIDIIEGDGAGAINYVEGTPAASPRPANLTPGSTLLAVLEIGVGQTTMLDEDIREMHFENVFLEHDHYSGGYGEAVDHAWLDNILGVDETSTNATKDKHISNLLMKTVYDILPWLSSTTPVTVAKANAIGAATNLARSNHVHQALWGTGAGGAGYVRTIPFDIPIYANGSAASPEPATTYGSCAGSGVWADISDVFYMPSWTVLTGCVRKYILQALVSAFNLTAVNYSIQARLLRWSGGAWVAVPGSETVAGSGNWNVYAGWILGGSGEIAVADLPGASLCKFQAKSNSGSLTFVGRAALQVIDQVA